jgi:hypothetical protein
MATGLTGINQDADSVFVCETFDDFAVDVTEAVEEDFCGAWLLSDAGAIVCDVVF